MAYLQWNICALISSFHNQGRQNSKNLGREKLTVSSVPYKGTGILTNFKEKFQPALTFGILVLCILFLKIHTNLFGFALLFGKLEDPPRFLSFRNSWCRETWPHVIKHVLCYHTSSHEKYLVLPNIVRFICVFFAAIHRLCFS